MKPSFLKLLTLSLLALTLSCGPGLQPISFSTVDEINYQTGKKQPLNETVLKSWLLKDLRTDSLPGMSVEKAYTEIIKSKKGTTTIVAVIDSGVDIEHEDLKDLIWTNLDEVPNNGIDDDNNGYVDDIHGWNFLGDVVMENLEFVRYLKALTPRFEGKSPQDISANDKADFELYQKVKAEYDTEYRKTVNNRLRYKGLKEQVALAHQAISEKLGKTTYTKQDLDAITNPSSLEQNYIGLLSQMFAYAPTIPKLIDDISDGITHFQNKLDGQLNLETNFRATLGDNPNDISDVGYGNSQVSGPDPKKADARHGTHVAGIIAANRNNTIGLKGVANNVQLMVLRAVPDGDEYDKDIALAIRYAVDNGAKVINTSFGKYYSPHPNWVKEAILYAASKDVLIVNAAGNEAYNLDEKIVFPNDQEKTMAEISNNFLTVGAINYPLSENLLADFSNYGATNVDVFAPGVKIWSTVPLNNYEYLQGTSMAAPAVSGVAAVIRSLYPNLSAAQVKEIIMASGVLLPYKVNLGGDASTQKPLSAISQTGKIVNLYNALLLAKQY